MMLPKFILLLLLTSAVMLLVGCGGMSESDIEATVEARVAVLQLPYKHGIYAGPRNHAHGLYAQPFSG